MKAIDVGGGGWIYRRDLSRHIHGRYDDDSLADECWTYLMSTHTPHRQTSDRDLKISGELVAAKIRASTVLGRSDSELASIVEEQRKAIDRLLAFVPKRAPVLGPERLEELSKRLRELLRHLFPESGTPVITITEETEEDTNASTRISVDVPVDQQFDPGAFARSVLRLHREIAVMLRPEEVQAIRLVVEPALAEV